MTEEKPEDDLTIVGDNEPSIPDENIDAVPPEMVESEEDTPESEEVQPDSYPAAAENDPSHWQQDPLIDQGEQEDVTSDEAAGSVTATADGVTEFGATSDTALNDAGDADGMSDQSLRDETAEERYRTGDDQVPPAEPTIGEASGDVDFGDTMDDDEADASDDPAHSGGRSLGSHDAEDPGQ
ncbi:hypothetical protein [Arthrobacter castelli]|uniref:hypothetical protein n=1 Tax=Arthrobacter castelli TaxID=271431 RepID=UPI0004120442|nr:hypothetical protein [Arthrobacter castelli]